jgi:hypothetical protein
MRDGLRWRDVGTTTLCQNIGNLVNESLDRISGKGPGVDDESKCRYPLGPAVRWSMWPGIGYEPAIRLVCWQRNLSVTDASRGAQMRWIPGMGEQRWPENLVGMNRKLVRGGVSCSRWRIVV